MSVLIYLISKHVPDSINLDICMPQIMIVAKHTRLAAIQLVWWQQ